MEQPHSHTAGHAFTSFPGQCIGKQKEDKVNNKDLTPLSTDPRGHSGRLNDVYIETMMEGLRLVATSRKNTNVLSHIMGYYKKHLTADEKQELLEIIERYHKGLIPLVVPITILNHYVRKYDEPYLKGQYYLNPHPLELMLRNHV